MIRIYIVSFGKYNWSCLDDSWKENQLLYYLDAQEYIDFTFFYNHRMTK